MGKAYFIKHGMERPCRDKSGRVIPFVGIGDDTGYIELDKAMHREWIAQLKASNGNFGILATTAEALDELKKKLSAKALRQPYRPPVRAQAAPWQQGALPAKPAAVVPSDPPVIPSSIPEPEGEARVRKPRGSRAPKPPRDSLAPVPVSVETLAPKPDSGEQSSEPPEPPDA